jgi:HK97 family phage prohead protease
VEVRAPGALAPGTPADAEPAPAATQAPAAILDFIASNEQVDRYEEVIVASGWRLEAYRRNPVFQNSHQYGDILFTIGKALVTEVRDGCLFQRVEFALEVNPFARIAYGLYRGGFLNAVSVGFIPLRWEDGGPQSPWRRRYLEQELLEVSAVGIPANPDALQIGLKSGAVQRQDLREAAELLQHLVGSSRRDDPGGADHASTPTLASSSATPALSAKAPYPERFCSLDCAPLARWLQLARDIHAVMKRD